MKPSVALLVVCIVAVGDLTSELMTADQVAEAQRRAREWTPTPEP